ncbi:MAG: TM0106 family RecB-like putative nuclease, partial [Bdellovibrionales bacterium]|nr:TM0106 family RecB-like putative nuclease [Bdellovibrionales bacterium]
MNKRITGSDLYNYGKCAHKPYMDIHGNPKEKQDVHPLVKLLWESGVQYEDLVLDYLKDLYPYKSWCELEPELTDKEKAFEITLNAMNKGIDYIYQGSIMTDEYFGRPDLLIKVDGKSKFGDYHYIPVDIKLARVEDTWDDGKERLNNSQKWQVMFYGDILEQIQGKRPEAGYIYKTRSRKLKVDLNRQDNYYDKALSTIKSYNEVDSSYPALSSICKMCEWKASCKSRLSKDNDASMLFYVGRAMQTGLKAIDIETVEDLSRQDPAELRNKVSNLKKSGFFWKSMSLDLVDKSIARAKVFQSKKEVVYTPFEFPESDFEIHYDIEDDPTQDFVYLHGLVIANKNGDSEYVGLLAQTRDDEKRITEEFIDILHEYKDAPVYHYSNYENSTLRRLIGKYPDLDQSIYED